MLDTLRRMEEEGTAPFRLSNAELALLHEAEAESDRGEFVSDEEMKAFFERLEKA